MKRDLERLDFPVRAAESATGHRFHKNSLMRWIQSGRKGVRLEACKVGGRWMVSVEAILRFIEATTQASSPTHPQIAPRSLRQRQSDVERAVQALNKEGV